MRMLVAAAVLVALALGLRTGPVRADTAAAAAPCSAPEYHQMDFWVGDWDVYEPSGKLQGHNKVEKIYDGCVLQEHWVGTEGDTGSSFNIYDASRQVWNETWVSNRGYLLSFDGRLHGKDMVLIGSHLDAHGLPELHRGVWTPTDYGVHQTWEVSTDGGRSWTMRFEGILRRSGQHAAS